MFKSVLSVFVCLLLCFSGFSQINIIPRPVEMQQDASGKFTLNNKTVIAAGDERAKNATKFLNGYLKDVYGISLPVKAKAKQAVQLIVDSADVPEGGYTLVANNAGVVIRAADGQGLFYGIQTLIQLLPTE